MHIICLTPLAEGVYNDHCADRITAPPEGWAYIPEDFPLPATFPRLGSIEAETVDGVMTVVTMSEGTLPEPEPETEPAKTSEERIAELEEALELLLSGDTGEEVAGDET